MRFSSAIAAMMALVSVSEAMADAFAGVRGLEGAKKVLLGRQDGDSQKSSDAPKSTAAAQSSDKPTATSKDSDNKESATGKASGSGAAGSGTVTSNPKSTSFDPRLPAGGLTMVTPNAIAGDQFYRVGDWVTFAWNYTSLSVTPTAIDVLASCTANQATYTIAVNMSASETKVLWDTANTPSGQAPFLTEKYTLLIYDAESSVSAVARAGYLGVFNQFSFGMYTPQPYVGWQDFKCANCNAAFSLNEKMTFATIVFTTATTVSSLLYFTFSFGMW